MSTNQSGLYDPYVSRGEQATGAGPQSADRTRKLNEEIDDVVLQMKDNLKKTSERGERLDDLQDKTDALATQANGFRRGANRVRKQMWWKDMKMRMCIIVGIIVLLVVIIAPSVYAAKHH
ncbi:hypothetical protein LTR36_000402 [Oleoguttula mirabilis]|uniref:V-SNARE coiled-coil homology domain-containing protein n=1 Tax=Oleoguttula mirabilis TaxID=1507867 RepID=A0AAV9K0H1_9PEZI|nr:hypothetical protein LTR36_000402 [Oleoguttula mirabilis]